MGKEAFLEGAEQRSWSAELCRDMGFLELQCSRLGFPEVDRRLKRSAAEHGGVIRAIHQAMRAEACVLRRGGSELPMRIYNRLRTSGWEARRIEEELTFPKGLPAGRLRYANHPRYDELTLERHEQGSWACSVSPDGRLVASASRDKTLRVWDLVSGEESRVLRGHGGEVRDCAFTPDGTRVLSASSDKTLKVWDLGTGEELATLNGHKNRVIACTVSADGRHAVSASTDRTLRVWSLDTSETLAMLSGHQGEVRDCALMPNGEQIVSVARDGLVKLWDLCSGQETDTLEAPEIQGSSVSRKLGLNACAVSHDGRQLVVGADNGLLRVWDLRQRRPLRAIQGHSSQIFDLTFTRDGREFIAVDADGTLRVWDLDTGRNVAVFDVRRCLGFRDIALACAVLPDDQRVVSAGWDGTLRVWDLDVVRASPPEEAAVPACSTAPQIGMRSSAASADGRYIVDMLAERTLQVRSLETGAVAAQFCSSLPKGGPTSVAAGTWCVVAAGAAGLQALDLETGREIASLVFERPVLGTHSVTHDDRWVVFFAEAASELCIWDLKSNELVRPADARRRGLTTTPAQRCAVLNNSVVTWSEDGRTSSAFDLSPTVAGDWVVSSDGRHVAACAVCACDALTVWDVANGKPIVSVGGQPKCYLDQVWVCAITSNNRFLLGGTPGGGIRIWELETGALVRTIALDGGTYRLGITSEVVCSRGGRDTFSIFEGLISPEPEP